jgi:hypothetical protein
MNNNENKILAISLVIGISLLAFFFHFQVNQEIALESINQTASTYESISGLQINETSDQSFSGFLSAIYNWGIAIGVILAVLFIVFGAIQYMSTDAVSGKTEGREKIKNALLGLLLLLTSYLILYTINPDLIRGNFISDRESENTTQNSEDLVKEKERVSEQNRNTLQKNFNIITDPDFEIGNTEMLTPMVELKNQIPGTLKVDEITGDSFTVDLASSKSNFNGLLDFVDQNTVTIMSDNSNTIEDGNEDIETVQVINFQTENNNYTYQVIRDIKDLGSEDTIEFILLESN